MNNNVEMQDSPHSLRQYSQCSPSLVKIFQSEILEEVTAAHPADIEGEVAEGVDGHHNHQHLDHLHRTKTGTVLDQPRMCGKAASFSSDKRTLFCHTVFKTQPFFNVCVCK
jgi:hypothetical protein